MLSVSCLFVPKLCSTHYPALLEPPPHSNHFNARPRPVNQVVLPASRQPEKPGKDWL